MEHFDIILALSKAALETKSLHAEHHVQRLRDALKTNDSEKAAKLTRLLNATHRRQDLVPLAIEEMRAAAEGIRSQLQGEILTRNTPLPRDKETSAPLVRVLFPDESKVCVPVLAPALAEAVADLLNEWKHSDRLALYGAVPHTRCLLYGPPGVGKTELARFLARQLDLPCVEARLDGLVSSFLGTTARNIGGLFDFANRYRCLLFLDEFDALAKARDDAHELGEIKRVVNSLLQSLDAREGRGFTIAATNHEHLLDAAVWRRFDARIEVPKPDSATRSALFERYLAPLQVADGVVSFLVWLSSGLSAADIADLSRSTKRHIALHASKEFPSLEPADLMAALRRFVVLNAKLFATDRVQALAHDRTLLATTLAEIGLNQAQCAQFLGVSQSTISRSAKKATRRSVTENGTIG